MAKQEKRTVKKMTQSTQSVIPIKENYHGMIVTKDNRFIGLMEVQPTNFESMTPDGQNDVIKNFKSFLKIAPKRMQFKIINLPANLSYQIESMTKDILKEENSKCITLKENLLNNYKVMENRSSHRRFFLSFEVERALGLNNRSVDGIYQNYVQQREQMSYFLKNCGNTVKDISDDPVYYTDEMLYACLNRGGKKPYEFRQVTEQVYENYVSSGKFGNAGVSYIPHTEFIAPLKIEFEDKSYIKIDDRYYSYCYIPGNGYTTTVLSGWLARFINRGEGYDIDVFIEKQDNAAISSKLRSSIKYNSVNSYNINETQDASYRLSNAIDAGKYLLDGIHNNEDFYYISTFITISGNTPEEVNSRFITLKDELVSMSMNLTLAKYEQEQAFISTIPLCKPNSNLFEKSKRNILSDGLAGFYPFFSFEQNDRNGVMFGIQTANNSPAIVDIFDNRKYVNGNAFITGVTGAGKSGLLKMLALRLRMRFTPVYVIVPEKQDEFREVCEAVGGQFIELGAGSPTRINIMQIFKRDDTVDLIYGNTNNSSLLAEKIQDLKSFFALYFENMSQEEKQILDDALVNTYAKKEITYDNKSLIDPQDSTKFKDDMPIIEDLYNVLVEMSSYEPIAKKMSNIIKPLVSGSGSSFNGLTNVDLNNNFIVIGLEKTNEDLLPASMFLALDFLFSKIKEDKTKQKVLFIEEVWKLMMNRSAASRILEISKIIRAYGGSLILATQQLKDITVLDNGMYGDGIINSCAFKIVLKHTSTDKNMLMQSMKLTEQEASETASFERGEGFVIANGNTIRIRFILTASEYAIITTDPRDLAMRKAYAEQLKANRQKAIKHNMNAQNIIDMSEFENSDVAEIYRPVYNINDFDNTNGDTYDIDDFSDAPNYSQSFIEENALPVFDINDWS